jgi:PAS domain S-box-containing protein
LSDPRQPSDPSSSRAHDAVLSTLLIEAAEAATLGIFVYDDDGKYIAVNKCAAELLGYEREELLSHDVGDFTEGGIDRSILLKPARREGVRLIRRKDGTTLPVAFVVTPTRVASLDFYFAVVWALPSDDPRAASAT